MERCVSGHPCIIAQSFTYSASMFFLLLCISVAVVITLSYPVLHMALSTRRVEGGGLQPHSLPPCGPLLHQAAIPKTNSVRSRHEAIGKTVSRIPITLVTILLTLFLVNEEMLHIAGRWSRGSDTQCQMRTVHDSAYIPRHEHTDTRIAIAHGVDS